MNIENLSSIEEIRRFLDGSQPVAFKVAATRLERYACIQRVLIKHDYLSLSKQHKGLVVKFLCKVSGYSRQQITRLIKQYRSTGKLIARQRTSNGFKTRYTREDIHLLAKTDELHLVDSGAAIKKICERAYHVHGQEEYKRLANISVSHLYNLRQSKPYAQIRRHFEKTNPKASSIGVRHKPRPNGCPGYIRVDTVHQGDLDGVKGVYHINAVDEVTQFEVVISVEKISESYLIPALEEIIEQFPFKVISIHSDNGSEYINQHVAKLLNKLLIELTKSRARHSNDNALAESKNASVVRKVLGYTHLPQESAPMINTFNRNFLNPYVNFHRPCYFPRVSTNSKGKQIKIYQYEDMMTPYEKLKSLPDAASYLKKGLSFQDLDLLESKHNDNDAAKLLQSQRKKLFKSIFEQSKMSA